MGEGMSCLHEFACMHRSRAALNRPNPGRSYALSPVQHLDLTCAAKLLMVLLEDWLPMDISHGLVHMFVSWRLAAFFEEYLQFSTSGSFPGQDDSATQHIAPYVPLLCEALGWVARDRQWPAGQRKHAALDSMFGEVARALRGESREAGELAEFVGKAVVELGEVEEALLKGDFEEA